VLYPRDDGANAGYGFPVGFAVQISTGAVHWATIASRNDFPRPAAGVPFSFEPRAVRHVRVTASKLRANPNAGGSYAMQFTELEVYGPGR
jgi:hypothetical protein